MIPPETGDEWVWLARLRRPQGRKGEVFAEILTDFPEKFAERRRLWLVAESDAEVRPRKKEVTPGQTIPRQMELVNHWLHKGGIVLHFAGVDSISAAEALAGLGVAIPRSERAKLGADEAYVGDLIGCVLVDLANGKPLEVGTIEDVDRTAGPVAMLIVRSPGSEIIVPFAKSYLRRIDIERKRVEMALPEGLADLNRR
ncbi:MAG TPA: ribosome maturation factor RimM [Terracidiphilus sp.]|nr:ribosome maturation factor RimM [Terracidiphilus sp.]